MFTAVALASVPATAPGLLVPTSLRRPVESAAPSVPLSQYVRSFTGLLAKQVKASALVLADTCSAAAADSCTPEREDAARGSATARERTSTERSLMVAA